jgi:hypothetical protein
MKTKKKTKSEKDLDEAICAMIDFESEPEAVKNYIMMVNIMQPEGEELVNCQIEYLKLIEQEDLNPPGDLNISGKNLKLK